MSLAYDPVYSFNLPPDNRTDDCPRCGSTIFVAEGGFCEHCAESDAEAAAEAAWEEDHRNDSIMFQIIEMG